MSVARRSNGRRAVTAASSNSRAPLVATITGSTTSGRPGCAAAKSATTPMSAAFSSIPVLTAQRSKASATCANWSRSTSGSMPCTSPTPKGFCAVTAVMAAHPCTPCAQKARRSASTPAPPPLSLPAIVNATGIFSAITRSFPFCEPLRVLRRTP